MYAEAPERDTLSSFVLTDINGDNSYGVCCTFYMLMHIAPFTNESQPGMQILNNSEDEQHCPNKEAVPKILQNVC